MAETLDVVNAAVRLAEEASEPYAAIQQIGRVGDETPNGGGKSWVRQVEDRDLLLDLADELDRSPSGPR